MSTQQVAVGIEIEGQIVLAGVLLVDRSTSGNVDRSVGRFRYAGSYLKNPLAVTVDPLTLPLTAAEFRFVKFGGLPGALRDSAPDNWGRALIDRVYRSLGHMGRVSEVDYLLASPVDRSSNLHFSSKIPPEWGDKQMDSVGVPALGKLQQHVVEVLRAPPQTPHRKVTPEVLAMMTGSGGARPKVNFKTKTGTYMAKLAMPNDDKGSMARMESASLLLAGDCGIVAAETRVKRDADFDMVLVRRFDRNESGNRRQMISAMTVLGANDQAFDRSNWSYPMLAREFDRWSADPKADKLQLFRCMVLRAMVSDSDDHPRNYALIRVGNKPGSTFRQWRLSPMYDCVVGMGQGRRADELAMTIGRLGYTISKENILSDCASFGLTHAEAATEVDAIESRVLRTWKSVFRSVDTSEADIALCASAIAPLDERATMNAVERLMHRMGAPAAEAEIEIDSANDADRMFQSRPRAS